MNINLKFFQKYPNAGDQFSRIVAQHYFSKDITSCDNSPLTQPNLILLGSILEWSDKLSYICGAGLISSQSRLHTPPRKVNCVRGPLTALFLEKQGIKAASVFADPGILASKLFPQTQLADFKLGIIPHYMDINSPWLNLCRKMEIPIIDVLSPLDEFFNSLKKCEIILSSSLHGIIFAHAYEKPALWIELSNHVIGNGFKFFDYYLSIDIPVEQVIRLRVSNDMNPYEIASLATNGSHKGLLPSLEEAIALTKHQLLQEGC